MNKTLTKRLRDVEQTSFLKLENLHKENTLLRTQGTESVDTGNTFNATKSNVKIEQLETQLADLIHQSNAREFDLNARNKALQRSLQDAEFTAARLSDADPESLKKLENCMKDARDRFEAYIVELETKLEMYVDNGTSLMSSQKTVLVQKEIIMSLRTTLESVSPKAVKGSRRSTADLKRLKELDKRVNLLEKLETCHNHKTPLVDILALPRPNMSDVDVIKHLKSRIHKLEADLALLLTETDSKIHYIHEEVKNV